MNLDCELQGVNQSLQSKGVSLRIEQRGERLNLRGPLPSKTTTDQGSLKTQRISLCLLATKEGLKEAEQILELILLQIQRNQFKWDDWSIKKSQSEPIQVNSGAAEAIKSFKHSFFSTPYRRQSPSGSRTTWRASYLPYLNRLKTLADQKKVDIDRSLLNETLTSYKQNSRSRQQCATALGALATHLNIELPEDWRAKACGYGLHLARFRDLPSDKLILDTWEKIPNPKWKLAYGLMATYGLRNHEVFFCDLSSLTNGGDKVIRVLPNTKTGEHQSWPFHPQWVDHFGLNELSIGQGALPPVNTNLNSTTLQQVGKRVAEQFRRYNLPITPYDLRHAWAVRTIHIGLPDTVAARMMGHSVAIHTRTYHHWITRRDQQRAVDTALGRQSNNLIA